MADRVRCCCPCMCDFQADMPPPLPFGVQFMHAPRCPECEELYYRKVEPHTGPAIVHGGIKYWSGPMRYGSADRSVMRR